ncbi:MAG TPA: glutamine-hydrolyzing carbamoyl-phosphate synthase small subunit [Opitutaceae bacterium]|nr:glutamine-hydrolyzing carbamoyl-phosphate synthase small subunit [Opitutaceae bacterium]
MPAPRPGILALEDGSVFRGLAFGAEAAIAGEAVFNTSMTGYQEILTDPSYYGQIVTMTAVQIGNYGINPDDEESAGGPKVAGFVVRELSPVTSNWRSRLSLDDYLRQYRIPGLQDVDTRTITKKLRVTGAMKCCLSTAAMADAEAVRRARAWEGLVGMDYVKEVTCRAPYQWDPQGQWDEPFQLTGTTLGTLHVPAQRYKVVAIDYGIKRNILRKLRQHGFDVWVVPASATAEMVDELAPDAVFLSNGPGDPDPLDYAYRTVARLIQNYPTFGICMGNHMITLALGAKTFKLKFGHRGANQPVKNLETGRVSITAQNHGFAARPEDLEQHGATVTEINLNDGTVEGLRHKELPVFSVQYHPEASPGPHDADPLFVDFYRLIERRKAGKI